MLRRGPPVKRQGGQRLDGVAQDVQARARGHLRGQLSGIVRIDHSQHRAERAVRDARLGVQRSVIEDRHAGCLASRPGRGRHRDERLQPPGDRKPLTDRRIDIGQQFRGIGRVQVGGLGRIDARAAADGDITVESPLDRKRDGGLKRLVRGLDLDLIEQHRIDSRASAAPRAPATGSFSARLGSVTTMTRRAPHWPHVVPDLAGHAGAVLDAGGIH